jgi:hypothetical protein
VPGALSSSSAPRWTRWPAGKEPSRTRRSVRAVAEAFDVRRRDVSLVTGAASRDKVVDIDGEAAYLAGLRDRLLGSAWPVP